MLVGGCFFVQRSWLSFTVESEPSVVGMFIMLSVSELFDVSSRCRFLLAKLDAFVRDWKEETGLYAAADPSGSLAAP